MLSGIPGRPGPAGRPGDAGGSVALRDEGAGFAARYKAEIREAVDRQTEEGVVDHQMVDVLVGNAGLGEGLGPAMRKASEEAKSTIWLKCPSK